MVIQKKTYYELRIAANKDWCRVKTKDRNKGIIEVRSAIFDLSLEINCKSIIESRNSATEIWDEIYNSWFLPYVRTMTFGPYLNDLNWILEHVFVKFVPKSNRIYITRPINEKINMALSLKENILEYDLDMYLLDGMLDNFDINKIWDKALENTCAK